MTRRRRAATKSTCCCPCKVCLNPDTLCVIMHHYVNLLLSYRKVKHCDARMQLLALCATKECLESARHEMRRLYFLKNVAWHYSTYSGHSYVLDTLNYWHVMTNQPFTCKKRERISVLFENETVSCLSGFIVLYVKTFILKYISVADAKCGIAKDCIVCPVFSRPVTKK